MQAEPEKMLKEINNAIYAIMIGGQEYRIGGRYLKRADLGMLRQMRTELEAQVSSGNDDGLMDNTMVAFFDRR